MSITLELSAEEHALLERAAAAVGSDMEKCRAAGFEIIVLFVTTVERLMDDYPA
jgi:hypothetical protein